jgi:lipopolysaccharide export system protein LptA
MQPLATVLLTAGLSLACAAADEGVFAAQDDPVQIDATTLVVHDKSKTATFSGNVQVVQGDNSMRCRSLIVSYGPSTSRISRMEAYGSVTVRTKDQSASGDVGIYNAATKTFTLIGDVVITPNTSQQ